MEGKQILQETMTVKSSETDFQKRLKLSNFFLWMQDVASEHARQLGFGYADLLQQQQAWILSRVKVRFFAFPEMDQVVQVQTWPKGVQQKLFFMRDYRMSSPEGKIYALATSAYVVVDLRKRRVMLPQSLDVPVPDNGGLYALDELLEKIPPLEDLEECYSLTAGYSAVDIMEHVNNARYVDWITDCFPIETYQDQQPDWLQINYLNEVKPGETVRLLRGQRPEDPAAWYLAAKNQSSGARAFEAELHWKSC